ncbi:hypothetical protein L1075_11150 [Chromohalobacter beijerinckii]|nr:HD domain-containing phosphohydrolase [Chromohalobacter beijerinckii]MCK0766258.1 hypothetical protein [Chromohalobacter beijerinckii]
MSTSCSKRSRNWAGSPSEGCLDVIQNANELLDGSGYPAGKTGDELSEFVKHTAGCIPLGT